MPISTDLLYQALESRWGIKVATDNVELLRQKLYRLRKQDPLFEELSFIVSPTSPTEELWIVRKYAQERKATPESDT